MKKFLVFCLCFNSLCGLAQLKSHVDERVELTSLVFRLAGAEEYINNEVKNYVKDVDAYFSKFKNHQLITYVKETIRERDSVAYNAVACVVDFLQIKNGKVELAKDADIDCLLQDRRWRRETFLTFVKLLNKFYRDTDFQSFFNRHKPLYAETEKRLNEVLADVNTEWFRQFFGQPLKTPIIYASLLNGSSNYGGRGSCADDDSGYISIGCSAVDNDGIPVFGLTNNFGLFYVIIHELCHIFTGPLFEKYENTFSESGRVIFPYVKEKLEEVAYGDAETMMTEGLNNLCTNLYCRDNNYPFAKHQIRFNEDYGFIWMRRAMKFMENFYTNRNSYPRITDFMPQYIDFMNFTAKNIEQTVFEYEHSSPYVVNVFPAVNSVVSSDIKEIRVEFNVPMWSSSGIYQPKDSTVTLPSMLKNTFWDSEKEKLVTAIKCENGKEYELMLSERKYFVIPVELEKGKNYGLTLPANIFQSSDTYPMREDFEIKFSTEP